MEAPGNDVMENEDCIIREVREEQIACENAHPVSSAELLASKSDDVLEWMASRPVGQMIFKSVDHVLWCFEQTLIWQNPCKGSIIALPRPFNVLFAYPLAAFLWILQHLMFAKSESPRATELIKWVQAQRRRLRSVQYLGICNMKRRNALYRPETGSWRSQLFWFLGKIPACSEPIEVEDETAEEGIEYDINESENKKKRRFSALSVVEDDCTALLDDDEYNSESDSDYVPECSFSTESADEDDDSDEDDENDSDEDETEDILNESVGDSEASEKTTMNGDLPTPKEQLLLSF